MGSVVTTDLGARIETVIVAGTTCDLVGESTSTHATVRLPPGMNEGAVSIDVVAANGNACSSPSDAFIYYVPDAFGLFGPRAEISEDGTVATRTTGVNHAVCLGARPLRRFPEGRYFEVIVESTTSSAKTFAVGVSVFQKGNKTPGGERLTIADATALERVWSAGYDAGGAKFHSDGSETKIATSSWRPVKDVESGSRIGILWAEPDSDPDAAPELVVFQDGSERIRLHVEGRIPQRNEDLFALVDLVGAVTSVRLVEGSRPPVIALDTDAAINVTDFPLPPDLCPAPAPPMCVEPVPV